MTATAETERLEEELAAIARGEPIVAAGAERVSGSWAAELYRRTVGFGDPPTETEIEAADNGMGC